MLAAERFEEAVDAHHRALKLRPEHVDAHYNLGAARQVCGDWDQAEQHYNDAIRLKPDQAEAHYSRALIHLSQGKFSEGWQGYEWRMRCRRFLPRRFVEPRWDGTPLAGRALFVHAEQGLGDTLQFFRYVKLLADAGEQVWAEAPKALLPLLEQSGFTNLLPRGTMPPSFDVHLPLMSLPLAFGTTLSTVPNEVPYISAEPALAKQWRDHLAPYEGFQIGINWQGNPEYTFDRYRSFPLLELEPIAKIPTVRLISLQKQFGLDQLSTLNNRFEMIDLGDQLDTHTAPFMDTAAVLQNLDLVITSDSAVAHLAGAMGVPVWLATSYAAEWRWLAERDDNPWYPTMRLFRQPKFRDWQSVFARMAETLASLVTRSHEPHMAHRP